MAKISLENITSGFNLQKINSNFQKIQLALQNRVYWRDNPLGEPNSLLTDLDANGRAIYNLPEPTVASQAARLQDVQNAISGVVPANLVPFTPYKDINSTNVQAAVQHVKDDVDNVLTSLLSSLGSSLIGFIQRGFGSRLRSLEDKLYDLVYVDDYDGDVPTRMERAAAEGSVIKFTPGKTYLINRDVDISAAGVTVDARGATLVGDGVSILMKNPQESNWLAGTLNNIKVPWSIIRNPNTWAEQTIADVTQSNDGYIPGGLDTDITPFLTSEQVEWNKSIGIKLVFTSTDGTSYSKINVSDIRGRFLNVIFQGCSDVSLINPAYKPGFEYGGAIFYNDVSVARDLTGGGFTPLGFTFARGKRNKVINPNIDGCNLAGIVFYGNDDFEVIGGSCQNSGESGVKTYQNDTHYGPSVICRGGKIIGVTSNYHRFDGFDLSATYPATGTQSGHTKLIACTAKGNRSTGVYSDAQSNIYIGNEVSDNGTFGMRITGANSIVKNNTLENNVKLPGMLGLTNVQDLSLEGDNIEQQGNTVRRSTPPPYTYAYQHIGTGGSANDHSIPFPVNIDDRVLLNVTPSNDRITRTPTAFVQYLRMLEPTGGIQAAQYLHRRNSQGRIVQFLQGPGESDVGSISVTATSTSYGTSSDYRLKEKLTPISNSVNFINSLNPVKWVWKRNGEEGVGFIAHELQKVSPSSVTGIKDAVDSSGNPIYQSVEYGSSEMMAHIVANLQDINRRLADIETK